MSEQDSRGISRRQVLKWTFGVLAAWVGASKLQSWEHFQRVWAETEPSELPGAGHGISVPQYLTSRPSLAQGYSLQRSGGQDVLRSPKAELLLSPSAYFLCSRCDGNQTLRQLGDALATEYGIPHETAHADVVQFFNCLYRLGVMSFELRYRLDERYETQAAG